MSQELSLEAALFNVESIHHVHGQDCLCGFKSAVSRDRTKHIMAVTLEAAGKATPAPVGFVVVDIKTRKLDWDGELHPTRESGIKSLTASWSMWCRTPEEATDERTYYGEVYEILPVTR